MARSTLGNPRVKESKGARQARLLRALEHRVRRLEKLARPAVMYEGAPIDPEALLGLRTPGLLQMTGADFAIESPPCRNFASGKRHRAAQDAYNREATERVLGGHLRFHYRPEADPWPWRAARALHRSFVNLRRRALGAVTPSYGDGGAGSPLSDDTQ